MTRALLTAAAILASAVVSPAADQPVVLAEKFDENNIYKVEVVVSLSGKLALPGKDKATDVVPMSGSSKLTYDERAMPADDAKGGRVVRNYQAVDFNRTFGDRAQKATVREAVRRMVVTRSEQGVKSAFSPDGPLTWNEIDVVKNDLFLPTLVAGLLPAKAVKEGDKWDASRVAVADLTDLEKIEDGGLTLEFLSVVMVSGRRHAKLAVSGMVSGVNEDGPNRQKLDGSAYFDLEVNRLSYLKLIGVHEMLGPEKQVTGRIEGSFVMTREAATLTNKLTDAQLMGLDLKPTAENSQLLYDNPELGVKFQYPRRWRVSIERGMQVMLEEPRGGGILLTLNAAGKTPTAKAFQDEAKGYLTKQKATLAPFGEPKRVNDKPPLDRFAFDADFPDGKARLEYAVQAEANGGVTVAARFPTKEAADLAPDLDRVLKHLTVTKPVVEKK